MTQVIDRVTVRGNETANGGKRLAEGTHQEVHLAGHTEVMAGAAATDAQDTEPVSLVDHDIGIVLTRQAYDFGQWGYVAFHREHTVSDDELDGIGTAPCEFTFERNHISMPIFAWGGE